MKWPVEAARPVGYSRRTPTHDLDILKTQPGSLAYFAVSTYMYVRGTTTPRLEAADSLLPAAATKNTNSPRKHPDCFHRAGFPTERGRAAQVPFVQRKHSTRRA